MSNQEENDRKEALASLTDVIGGRIYQGYKNTKFLFSSARIYRVPQDLRELNESAYTPRLIAIGPLHREDPHLPKTMQPVKMYYANYLFFRLTEGTEDQGLTKGTEDQGKRDEKKFELLQQCVEEMKQLVDRAKKCYAEEVEVNDDEMAEMMLVDGCFILELLYASYQRSTTKGGDSGNSKASSSSVHQLINEVEQYNPIIDNILTSKNIKRDLLLLENQIPFFVLEELFKLTVDKIPGGKKLSLEEYFISYFGDIMISPGDQWEDTRREDKKNSAKKFSELDARASELDYGGVKFVPVKKKNLFDVEFREHKGLYWWFHSATFDIPTLIIRDHTEPFFRNLLAFEQLCSGIPQYFTSYAKLMDVLINSEKDVQVLTNAKVIENYLDTDKDVFYLFNNLCKEIVTEDFYFRKECEQAFNFTKRNWWPMFIAYLKRLYFANPWRFIGFFLAYFTFGMQVIQFIYDFLK